jgi:hypothetical protein
MIEILIPIGGNIKNTSERIANINSQFRLASLCRLKYLQGSRRHKFFPALLVTIVNILLRTRMFNEPNFSSNGLAAYSLG